MAHAAAPSLGSVLKIFDAAGTTSADLVGVTSFTPPAMMVEVVDVTTLSDTVRQRRSTVRDIGPCSGTVQYDSDETSHVGTNGLQTLNLTAARRKFTVALNDTGEATVTFFGYVTKWELGEQSPEGIISASFEIQVDGDVTIA